MRNVARAAIAAAMLFTAGAATAADGRFGPTSSGSITIRVSVAPRAWQASGDTLCVAGPPAGYSLRLADESSPLRWTRDEGGSCAFRATQLKLVSPEAAGAAMLLVVPE